MNFAFLLPLLWYGDTSLISVEQLDTDTGVGDHCDTRRSPKGCITLLNGGETLGLVQVGSQAIKSQNTTKLFAKADRLANRCSDERRARLQRWCDRVSQHAVHAGPLLGGWRSIGLWLRRECGFAASKFLSKNNFLGDAQNGSLTRAPSLHQQQPGRSNGGHASASARQSFGGAREVPEDVEQLERLGSPALPENVAWQFDITSICGQKVLAVQQVKLQDGQLGPIQVLGHRGSGRGKCLGSIDRKLQLVSGVGEDFGRLVRKQSGAYELKESATGRHRWLVQANMHFPGHEYFTVTWRPRRRLLATLNRGQGGHADYMKVMPTPGVDVVLVILCCVGLFVFRIDDQVEGQSMEEDPEAAGSGFAGNLLQNADGADD